MSDNKFIKRLKGEQTAKSVLEIKNESAKTSFANMPQGTSNAINVYSDHRGNATAVLEGTDIWKLNNSQFVVAPNAFGDGQDFTSTYTVAGSTLWVNATHTFDQPKIFTGATQWTLKLCGHSLLSSLSNTIGFSLIIKFGNAVTITKSFSASESAFEFCKEFIIDFSESEQTAIKVANGDTMTVQLLCADATASATIYNGMTTLVAQQRRVDGEAVASDLHTFEDLEVEIAQIQDDIVQIHEDIDDLEEYVDDTFVRLDGNSIMTAPLKFRAGSMRGAVGPYLNGVSFWKLDSQGNITNIANLTDGQFLPVTTNAIDLGRSANKWKDLYLAGKAYMSVINNGYDIAVPVTNSADTLALKSEVDLAANSGRMITDQGLWYAKMYAATVAPSAEDGTNYADFSQTDGQGNPIIVIYERQNGAWVQSETITPPAEYDGYVSITSKIWDIVEQAGQQGGRILWNHQSKEFTPYPQIISFEDIQITGNSTVVMPQNPSANQIVNKDYVDNAIGNGTITITQDGETKGTFTTNQGNDTTIDLDGGSSDFDLFDWKWKDCTTNATTWALSDGNWVTDKSNAYQHLVDDYNAALAEVPRFLKTTNDLTLLRNPEYDRTVSDVDYYAWTKRGSGSLLDTYFTTTLSPGSGYQLYKLNPDMQPSSLYVSSVDDGTNTETIAGYTITYYKAPDGHKIVLVDQDNTAYLIYEATGVAWYYILDTANQRFKLPRTKHNKYADTLGVIGNGIALGLTNGTGNGGLSVVGTDHQLAAYTSNYGSSVGDARAGSVLYGSSVVYGVVQDPTKSGIIAQQEQDTDQYKYLYFYVGN